LMLVRSTSAMGQGAAETLYFLQTQSQNFMDKGYTCLFITFRD
jgi:hypothetical protein